MLELRAEPHAAGGRVILTASRLLHAGAGCPSPEGAVPSDAPCWWCGLPSPGLAVPERMPDTFPDRHRAARSDSDMVCAPCAWTMSDRIALPAELADAGLSRKIAAGGRLRVSVRGDDPGRPRLFLRLADGRIGVWALPGKNAAADEPWLAAREALRVDPVGAVDIVTDADLSAGATARSRNYHHIGTPSLWRPCTAADRAVLRGFLLNPPADRPWVVVIGDGQKHGAIYATDAVVHPGDAHGAYVDGAVARWRPGELGLWLAAVEALRVAGCGDDEIAAGRYHRGDVVAIRRHEPTARAAREEMMRRAGHVDRDAHQRRLATLAHGSLQFAIERGVLQEAIRLMDADSLADLVGSIAAKIPELANKIAVISDKADIERDHTPGRPRLRVVDPDDDPSETNRLAGRGTAPVLKIGGRAVPGVTSMDGEAGAITFQSPASLGSDDDAEDDPDDGEER